MGKATQMPPPPHRILPEPCSCLRSERRKRPRGAGWAVPAAGSGVAPHTSSSVLVLGHRWHHQGDSHPSLLNPHREKENDVDTKARSTEAFQQPHRPEGQGSRRARRPLQRTKGRGSCPHPQHGRVFAAIRLELVSHFREQNRKQG